MVTQTVLCDDIVEFSAGFHVNDDAKARVDVDVGADVEAKAVFEVEADVEATVGAPLQSLKTDSAPLVDSFSSHLGWRAAW